MIATLYIGILCVFLAFLSRYKKSKYGLECAFILLTGFLAIRYNWGNDYPGYLLNFKELGLYNISIFDWSTLKAYSRNGELGWAFLNVLFKPFGFFSMVIALTVFEQYILYRFIKKHVPSKWYWIAIFLYIFGPNYLLIGSSMMRQYLAMTLYLIAVDFIYSKKFIPFIGIILLASTIHTSVLITLPTYFLRFIDLNLKKRTLVILPILSILWFFLAITIFQNFLERILSFDIFQGYERYVQNSQNHSFTIGIYIRFFVFFITIFQLPKLSPRIQLFTIISLLDFFLYPLYGFSILFSRIGTYFGLFGVFVYPCLIKSLKHQYYKWGLILILIILNINNFFNFFNQEVWRDSFFTYKTIFSI